MGHGNQHTGKAMIIKTATMLRPLEFRAGIVKL